METKTTYAKAFVGKCKACNKPVRVEGQITKTTRTYVGNVWGVERSNSRYFVQLPGVTFYTDDSAKMGCDVACPTCSKPSLVRPLIARVSEKKCGAKCRASHGPTCECSCGGANHGCG